MNISVFVTSYNQRDYLKVAIESVLAQTLPASQIIVVDDASTDGTPDLIADYARSYPDTVTPVYHQQNTGVAQVRIDALKAVRGDYVTYVDGDDWLLPEKLELETEALKATPDARIAFSNNKYVNEDGGTSLWIWDEGEKVPQGEVLWQTVGRFFPRKSLFRMELVHYESWCEIGFHDPRMELYEDYDMRIRLTKSFKVVYVNRVLSCIRTHQRGLSNSSSERHFCALDYLFNKNRDLINTLPTELHQKAVSGLAEFVAPIGLKAAKNALFSGRVIQAVKLWQVALNYRRLKKTV